MASDTEVRDQLALDRTHLANERTLLAYVRTALALIASGAGLLELVEGPVSEAAGWTFLVAGAVGLPFGVWRYLAVRAHLRSNRASSTPS
jgi:putative membrane protein